MSSADSIAVALQPKRGMRLLNLTWDDVVKYFFAGNAWVAILVLGLITVFLLKEGFGFFAQNRDNLEIYRKAGLEYVDIIRRQSEEFTSLTRELNALRLDQMKRLLKEGKTLDEANAALASLDEFSSKISDAGSDLYGLVSDLTDAASAIKEKATVRSDKIQERKFLLEAGKRTEAAAVEIPEIDFGQEVGVLKSVVDSMYVGIGQQVDEKLNTALESLPDLPVPGMEKRLEHFRNEAQKFEHSFPLTQAKLKAWNQNKPVGFGRSVTTFLFGGEWLTASFWQDWYGIGPLFAGSLLVSMIALLIAVPLGVCGAVYVNQVAGAREAGIIKPAIEFIAAFPSVVLGFFGIVVLGEFMRNASEWSWLSWVPFFPIQERLNATTAGVLLGLMAVPTIFSLAEDAINNVPIAYKEASFALGASRLQTLVRIILPAALSGIIAAVLLGFGRVIGETMVVLLCAGNRIAIPHLSEGLGVIFQPVHTMTGIIAQEMGEVEFGGIHYRALFMVAAVLFFLALIINYFAQKVVTRFKISIG